MNDKEGTANAYSLIRFSTDRQQWGDSMRRQIEQCKEECKNRGWRFDEKLTLQDLGVSAFGGNNFDRRFALGKFIEASINGLLLPNPVLIIENVSRFSRDVLSNAETEFWGLVKRGVDVLILSMGNEGLFTSGDENSVTKKAVLLFEFDRAHKESKYKSDMVQANFKNKFSNAAKGNISLLGNWVPKWVSAVYNGEKVRQNFSHYEEDKPVADVIRKMVKSYIDGQSMYEIANRLTNEKVPCLGWKKKGSRNKGWKQGQVSHILKSEALIGKLTIKGQVTKGAFPAIITETEWKNLQAALNRNKGRKGRKSGEDFIANLFRNRCVCSNCGGTVSTQNSKNRQHEKVYYSYKCSNTRYKIKTCTHTSTIPIWKIEEDFFGLYLQEYPKLMIAKQDKKDVEAIARVQDHILQLEKALDEATGLIGTPGMPVDKIKIKLQSLETERQAAKEHLQELTLKNTSNGAAPVALANIAKLLKGKFGDKETRDFDNAMIELEQQLKNNETRKKLLPLIPQLVEKLVINLKAGTYAVMVGGKQSSWRDVYDLPTIGKAA